MSRRNKVLTTTFSMKRAKARRHTGPARPGPYVEAGTGFAKRNLRAEPTKFGAVLPPSVPLPAGPGGPAPDCDAGVSRKNSQEFAVSRTGWAFEEKSALRRQRTTGANSISSGPTFVIGCD